jgi:NAD(P)-dependent dehydrogenase (short-subunit alcohol dehydrogenase family)
MQQALQKFSLANRLIIITGGAGLLGLKHAEAVMALGASVALLDINEAGLQQAQTALQAHDYVGQIMICCCDITSKESLIKVKNTILAKFGAIHGLINNAANNPKVSANQSQAFTRLENFSLEQWQKEMDVGLTGAFLCCQIFGSEMANGQGGVILNIASDLSVIAPDQRIYRQEGLAEADQPVKPVTYSVIKTALIGLTRYLATYWAPNQVRVNALSPGGVYQQQPPAFVTKLTSLIPMQRMAAEDEYHGAIQFLCSDASLFMTGQNVVMDGGRSVW